MRKPRGGHVTNLNDVSLSEVAKHTWKRIRAADVFGRSAQLAYYLFLALFPFLICVIASLSVFGIADRGRALLFGLFARFLPAPAFQLISNTFGEIIQSSGPLKMSLGIVASLWSASLGMGAVMDTLNAAYEVKESRSLIKQYVVALGLTLVATLLLVVSIAGLVVANIFVAHSSSGDIGRIAWSIIQWPLMLAAVLFALAITYYFAPDLKDRRWHWVTPGAIGGACLLIIVLVGLRMYLHYSASLSITYGSLGAVIVLLLCFYLSGIALLSGGVLNAVLVARPR
jgi:membrane protein